MTLIEVLVSSLLVAVIAVGTFAAFDAAGQSSADERAHAEGTQLAEQDQERLRGFTTTAVSQLGTVQTYRAENGLCLEKPSSTWLYYNQEKNTSFCEKVKGFAGNAYTGAVFTVTSSARYVAAEKGTEKAAFTCEKSGGAANYLQTTSSVWWTSLGTRPPISQSSIVAVPTSSVLLVKVLNQNNEPVEGATVTVVGHASETTTPTGCVIFGGLTAGTVEVQASKSNWVDHQGKSPPPAKTLTVNSVSVTETTFTIAEPGSIVVEFVESLGKPVEGDTFYALQPEIASPPDFVGGTASKYESRAALKNLLFPFVKIGKPPENAPYTVFAGDCEANNPAKVTEAGEKVKDKTAQVQPGGSGEPPVQVEVPPVNLTVYEGTKGTPGSALEGAEYASIENKECEAKTAQNYAEKVPYKHELHITSGAGNAKGHLAPKYQPYAKELILCVTAHLGAKYYRNTFKFSNTEKAGNSVVHEFFLKEPGFQEKTKAGEVKCP